MTLSLGIDVGTSGVRTAVLTGETVVSMARATHPPQDPERIDAGKWWQAVQTCIRSQFTALRQLGIDPAEISAIAVDGTSGSMVLTDSALEPVSPALMYNSKGFDAEAERIAALAPDPHITRGSNSALGRAMRLVSLADRSPAYLLHQADFIAAKLLGRGGLSDHNNSLKTGFDPETERWPGWAEKVIDPALLPKVVATGTLLGEVSDAMACELGLSTKAVVHAGTTDSIAAFLAAAPMEEGMAVTSLGSTLAVKLLSPKRIDDPGIGLYSHRIGDYWLVGGASNTGGAVLATFFSSDEIALLSERISPDRPTGLDYYPLNAPGERFPINDPAMPPRLSPKPEDDAVFLQAMLEGIARVEAECYREIAKRGGGVPKVIYTAGGGAKNLVWTGIRASALGLIPQTPLASEAAVGAARVAQVQ